MSLVDHVAALVAAGVPEAAGISPAELAAHAAVLPEVPGAVLAVHPSLAAPGRLAGLLRNEGRPGFVVADMTDVDGFAPIERPGDPGSSAVPGPRTDPGRRAAQRQPRGGPGSDPGGRAHPADPQRGDQLAAAGPHGPSARGVLHDNRVAQAHRSDAGGWSVPGDLDQPRHRSRRAHATQRAKGGLVLGGQPAHLAGPRVGCQPSPTAQHRCRGRYEIVTLRRRPFRGQTQVGQRRRRWFSGSVHPPRRGQYQAVFHHAHGRNCGRPFTCLVSPSVTKAGAVHTEAGRLRCRSSW